MVKSSRLTGEERKLSIMAASVPLFAEKGFKGTTTKEIAKAAGVSEALLYRHFPSKESIYSDLKSFCMQGKAHTASLITNLEPSTSTLVHIIYFLTSAIFDGNEFGVNETIQHDHMHRLLANSYLEDGAFARMFIQENLIVWEEILRNCVAEAVEAGDMLADWIDPSCRWWFAHHLAVGAAFLNLPEQPVIQYDVEKADLVDQITRFSLRGMGLKDEAIARYYKPAALALFMQHLEQPAETDSQEKTHPVS
jgi:AcrR family transcriptional regulator